MEMTLSENREQNTRIDAILKNRFIQVQQRENLDSLAAVGDYLIHHNQSEIKSVRQEFLSDLQKILLDRDIEQFKRLLKSGNATLLGGHGSVNAQKTVTMNHPEFPDKLFRFLDDLQETDDPQRIDAFTAECAAMGFKDQEGKPVLSNAALFVSVLLSSAYPDRFVDFRQKRWNALCTTFDLPYEFGSFGQESAGDSLLKAAKVAKLVAALPGFQETFRAYLADIEPLWLVAGLAELCASGFFDDNNSPLQQTDSQEKTVSDPNFLPPLNQIFYGPPGTGKTYHTINHALAIIEGKAVREIAKEPRSEVKARYDRYRDQGRIGFVTFHQSFGYEDFIEGIKPVPPQDEDNETAALSFDIQDGIFKQLSNRAKIIPKETDFEITSQTRFYKMSLGGRNMPDVHDWCIENNCIAMGWGKDIDFSEMLPLGDSWIKYRDAFIKKWPELAAKSRFHIQEMFILQNMQNGDLVFVAQGNQKIVAIGRVAGPYQYRTDLPVEFCQTRPVEWLHKDIEIDPDQFLKKKLIGLALYELYPRNMNIETVKSLFATHRGTPLNHVLIIDEINRGNIANIFGELITLIEPDKRESAAEALRARLPYSKEEFSVPDNLYIIATMNTADRSIEALDTALRRRFSFIEMASEPDHLKPIECEDIELDKMLRAMNQRIEKLLDRDHHIGHSYFMNADLSLSLDELRMIFKDKILPLLQEYFYGDYGKIAAVLGPDFIQKESNDDILFMDSGMDLQDYLERSVYRIMDCTELDKDSFIKIYSHA